MEVIIYITPLFAGLEKVFGADGCVLLTDIAWLVVTDCPSHVKEAIDVGITVSDNQHKNIPIENNRHSCIQ